MPVKFDAAAAAVDDLFGGFSTDSDESSCESLPSEILFQIVGSIVLLRGRGFKSLAPCVVWGLDEVASIR